MSRMKRIIPSILVMLLIFSISPSQAETINLIMAKHWMQPYVGELLIEALKSEGHQAIIKVDNEIPPKRLQFLMEEGKPGYIDFISDPMHIKNTIPVTVDLTGGLCGVKVFLIRKGEQSRFEGINSIKGLGDSGLVAVVGRNWFAYDVWKFNNLPVYGFQNPTWNPGIFLMLTSQKRDVDYFVREVSSVEQELKKYPELQLERNLAYTFKCIRTLRLSSSMIKYKETFEKALQASVDSGLMKRLLRKYFPFVYAPDGVNFDSRIIIPLKMPKR